MKRIKDITKRRFKSLLLFSLFALFTIASFAQLRTRVMPTVTAGNSTPFGTTGYTITGIGTADTLAVSDTVAYTYPVTANTLWIPFISIQWTKIGSGTATITAKFLQGNTSGNLTAVKAGSANATYTKTLTFSATGVQWIDLNADSAKISGRYLQVQFLTSATASVQGSIAGTINTQLR